MKPVNTILIIAISILLLLIGCTHGRNPVSPDESLALKQDQSARDSSNHMLWGYSELICNTETGEAEFLPLRSSELHINVLNPIMATGGMAVEMIPAQSDPINGLFVMDISLTHPFAGQDKFSGFDVKGILITPGTFTVDLWTLCRSG